MNTTVREMTVSDFKKIVDYFLQADDDYLIYLGADKSKLPQRDEWIKKIQSEFRKPYHEKNFYYIIWLIDGEAVGHSNVNNIEFGGSALMHLHLWNIGSRKKGLGEQFLKMSIPYYFQNLNLQSIICEPRAENIAPNKALPKVGFEHIRTYETTPGWINFHQTVSRYELSRNRFEEME